MANYGAWRVTYTEGQWVVLSGPSSMVVMEPAPASASDLLDEVWGAVLGAESITALAATLTSFGLDRMPAMAVLFHTDRGLKALLRGAVELRDGDTGDLIASGVGADTWHEVVAGTPRVFLHLDEVDPNAMLQLPLVVGAARASAVLVDAAAPVAVGATQFVAAAAPGSTDVAQEAHVVASSAPEVAVAVETDVALYDEPVPADQGPTPQEPAAETEEEPPTPVEDVVDQPVETEERSGRYPEAVAPDEEIAQPSGAEPEAHEAWTPVAPVAEEVPVPETPQRIPEVAVEEPHPLVSDHLPEMPGQAADSEPSDDQEDSSVEPSGLLAEQPDPQAPVLVALHEPQFDEDPVPSYPAVPVEPTQVLDGRPPYAPGQDPDPRESEPAVRDDAFGTQFGNAVTGTTGPFGAQGFGSLIASATPGVTPVPAPADSSVPPTPPPVEPVIPVRSAVPAPGPKVLDPTSDHDGATIFATGIAATHKPAAVAAPETTVMASVCALGHPNRPGARSCRICGGIVDAHNSQLVNRPVLGAVTTEYGDKVPLRAPIIVGRAPARPEDDPEAELLRVPSPGHDISRSHVRISGRDWVIEVTDLHSTNGTVVTTSDGQTFRLAAGQTVTVGIGDQIDLGDGQLLTITAP